MRKYLKILSLMTNSLFGSMLIESDEGFLEKEISTFTGNVSIKCSEDLQISCDILKRVKGGYQLADAKIENPLFRICSKDAFFDSHIEKGHFAEDVVLELDDIYMTASEAECLLENFSPQLVSLFSQKKEGCTLKSPEIKTLVFQRVNFDLFEKQALFFFPKGEILWDDKNINFSANVMKVEEGRLVLDGKIFIQIGKGIYTASGPLIIHFDAKEKVIEQCFAEGKSALAWNEYLFDLDGSFNYDSTTHKIVFKTPKSDGLNFKYPLGEITATQGEITLNTENLTIEEVVLSQDVFATYGIPTVQFLLADSIRVKPPIRLATLYAKESEKVLLYDQVNKLEMSSKQVNIEWGEKIGDEKIAGMGDVRFSFDQKEKGIIDALFKRN